MHKWLHMKRLSWALSNRYQEFVWLWEQISSAQNILDRIPGSLKESS